MNYTLLSEEQAKQVRERFESTFLKSFDTFRNETQALKQHININVMYSALFPDNTTRLDFYEALGKLATIKNNIYFLNDRCALGEPCELNRMFVGKTNDAIGLAKQIFDEWCREFYLGIYIFSEYFHNKTNNLFKNKLFLNLLPFDLYIFDESMKWMIAFTHEDCEDENEYNEIHELIEPRRCCYSIQSRRAQ